MRSSLLTAGTILLVSSVASGQVCFEDTISDGTMSASEWSTELFLTRGLVGSVTATQLATGGNPGFCWRVFQSLSDDTGLTAVHTYAPACYDPADSGGIQTIDFAIDYQWVASDPPPPVSGEQRFGLAANQGANTFVAAGALTGMNTNWQSHLQTGITSANFVLKSGSGTLDLSANAPPITFGFYTSNNIGPTTITFTREVNYDNFSVTITRTCEGDANGDGTVDVNDISYVLFRLGGACPPCDGDANGDGAVDVNDISFVLFRLGSVCP